MTRTEALDVLDLLAAAYPTYPLEKPTAELYVNALATVDAADAKQATGVWVKQHDRFPKVSELLAASRSHHQAFPEIEPPKDGKLSNQELAERVRALKAEVRAKAARK